MTIKEAKPIFKMFEKKYPVKIKVVRELPEFCWSFSLRYFNAVISTQKIYNHKHLIKITIGFLHEFTNTDVLIGMIGHEIGHVIPSYDTSQSIADERGVKETIKLGYNPKETLKFMQKHASWYKVHRIYNYEKACKKGGNHV